MKKILFIVVLILIFLIFSIAFFLFSNNYFYKISLKELVLGPYTLIYDEHIGDYSKVGPVMDKISKSLKADTIDINVGFGLYFDNPANTPKEKLRAEVGIVLSDKDRQKFESIKSKYKVKELKKIKYITADFPYKNTFSYIIGIVKAYPELGKYFAGKNIKTDNQFGMEIYDMNIKKIIYALPLE